MTVHSDPDITRPGSGTPGAPPRASSRFVPGALIGHRYRIVAQLGAGGMGEVYRAEDLTLGDTVALKFLSVEFGREPAWLERLRAEVRAARQVSHPNVCRVHDIVSVEGHHFISMEFVDGEDLASLLRRVGRLPREKGFDVARQLCAGLAATHERGVLHCDLKPANVMLDGRGQVRLNDFGLASLEGTAEGAPAGTPAYMAPELFSRAPPSVQSDIYALGLVIFEVLTGRRVFDAASMSKLAALHREVSPPLLHDVLPDADPGVEGILAACLAKDPAARPASALAVAAALPGGDPLAAALARGETPAVDVVAGAGGSGVVSRGRATVGLLLVAAGLFAAAALNGFVNPVSRHAPARSPLVLEDRAREVVVRAGYEPAAYHTFGLTLLRPATRVVDPARPEAILFYYRQSPQPMANESVLGGGRVSIDQPPLTEPGMVTVVLDGNGLLRRFSAVPPRSESTPRDDPPWPALFSSAGLDPATFTRIDPHHIPSTFADDLVAWAGPDPLKPSDTLGVHAAALAGYPVQFEVVETARAEAAGPWAVTDVITPLLLTIAVLLVLGGSAWLARRNLRARRADTAGARRLGAVTWGLYVLALALNADWPADAAMAATTALIYVSVGLFFAACIWLFYIAIEPPLRRLAPELAIGWTRLVAGRWNDPLVWRDVLVGLLVGLAASLVILASMIAAARAGQPIVPIEMTPDIFSSQGRVVSALVAHAATSVLTVSGFVSVFVILLRAFRRRRPAAILFTILLLPMALSPSPWQMAGSVTAVVMLALLVIRSGILATIVASYTHVVFSHLPLTLDTDVWFVHITWRVLGGFLVLAVLAWRGVQGRRPARA